MTATTAESITAGALLAETQRRLGRRQAAVWILSHVTGTSAATLRSRLEEQVPAPVVAEVRRLAARCAGGEPLQYVVGRWDFRTLVLELDRRVLIPRPETEQVVDVALGLLGGIDAGRPVPVVADLGTGSGAIALALAAESPCPLEVWATDVSAEALAVAERNLDRVRAQLSPGSTVHLAAGSWYAALPDRVRGRLDLVVSNPPYVARRQWEALDTVVHDHEPYRALVPGELGTEAVDVVVSGAAGWLAPGAWLVVEIGEAQGDHAVAVAASAGLSDVTVRPDLSGRHRVVVARRPVGHHPGRR